MSTIRTRAQAPAVAPKAWVTRRATLVSIALLTSVAAVGCGGGASSALHAADTTSTATAAPSTLGATTASAAPSTPAPTAAPSQTAAPTPTPRPAIPDAHTLTFQVRDIPPGFAPHPTSIMTLDASTVVSEQILSDAGPLRAAGYLSGAEYGWEASGTGRLAMQDAVLVVRDAAGARTVLAAEGATARSFGAVEQPAPTALGAEAHAYTKGALAEVQWRRGSIVASVEVTDGSLAHAAQLAQTLDQRYAVYG